MADIQNLTIVDASNTARFPEGQAPSTVNDGARALEGILARWHRDTNGSLSISGSVNEWKVTMNRSISVSVSALYTGLKVGFRINTAPTAATTFALNGITALPVKTMNNTEISSGDFAAGDFCELTYRGSITSWVVTSPFPVNQGTWTPTLTFATPGDVSVVYSTRVGAYTKIGRVVHLHGNITTSTFVHTTAAGPARITGIPFTSVASVSAYGPLTWAGITKANYTAANVVLGGSAVLLTIDMSGSGQAISSATATDMPTGGTVRLDFGLTYYI